MDYPVGVHFLQRVWEREDECQRTTDQLVHKLEANAPQTLAELGTLLSLLDRMASCAWGCAGGSHEIERLVGRCTNLARAAIRLLRSAFYDEALNLVRSLGEITNLLTYFVVAPGAFDRWILADRKQRKEYFGPGPVRTGIRKVLGKVPMDDDHYRRLCESVTHPTPTLVPQAYTHADRPILANIVQPAGVLIVLYELGNMLAIMALSAANIAPLAEAHREDVRESAARLLMSTGEAGITNLKEMLAGSTQAAPK
ncbi:MAG TPA: hypothetical protein VNW24_04255 [Stellaceae bacterium]|jgi:hypothetical protein|nr:hypothetical protein [Stellaceae bacterium]